MKYILGLFIFIISITKNIIIIYEFLTFLFISSFNEIFSHFTLNVKNKVPAKNDIIPIKNMDKSKEKTAMKENNKDIKESPFWQKKK